MSDTLRVIHWRVSGLVQGVGFRWFISRRARAIGVDGWVRNVASGEVQVLARGTEEQLARLHTLISEGPPGSRVDGVSESDSLPNDPPATPFSILA